MLSRADNNPGSPFEATSAFRVAWFFDDPRLWSFATGGARRGTGQSLVRFPWIGKPFLAW